MEKDIFELEKKERSKRYKKREQKRDLIKGDLLSQLEEKNKLKMHFYDLIEDYMSLWDIKNELIYDIESKGVSIIYKNGANQYGYKKNDSVPELNRVNSQMLSILRELDLKINSTLEDEKVEL